MQADVSDSDTHIERETHGLTNTHTHIDRHTITHTDRDSCTQTERHTHLCQYSLLSIHTCFSPCCNDALVIICVLSVWDGRSGL